MASANLIAPFPADIDRDAFGHWLSGFTDGEGCFMLNCSDSGHRRPERWGLLTISLRADDVDILLLIQSYLGCGRICNRKQYNNFRQPQFTYQVSRKSDLARVLVPHFDRFPLRAKKSRDYTLWREGVLLLYDVFLRPRRSRTEGRGAAPKMTDSEAKHFDALAAAMKQQRQYLSPEISVPMMKAVAKRDQSSLFDGIGLESS